MDDLITIDDLGKIIKMTRRSIDRRRAAGGFIREINIGGEGKLARIRFRRLDVEAYLKTMEAK